MWIQEIVFLSGHLVYIYRVCFGVIKIETIWSNSSGHVQTKFLHAEIASIEYLDVCWYIGPKSSTFWVNLSEKKQLCILCIAWETDSCQSHSLYEEELRLNTLA